MRNARVEKGASRERGSSPPARGAGPVRTGGVVSSSLVDTLLVAADRIGLDTDSMVNLLGVDRERCRGPEHLLSAEIEEALWLAIVRQAQARGVAIEMARSLGRGAFRSVEYLSRTSATLGGALSSFIAFHRILHGRKVFAFERGEGQVWTLRYDSPHWQNGEIEPYAAEFALACVLVVGRDAAELEWSPLSVGFAHEAPEDDSPHREFFGCPVRFAQVADEMSLDATLLDLRMREADPVLASVLEAYVMRAVEELAPEPGVAEAVRRVITEALPEGAPGLDEVARRVGMSSRALQRRLLAEGRGFLDLLEEVRAALARRYLQRRELSVPSIAFLLGYSDATAFHRAFKRWTGKTPVEYRRSKGW